MKKERILIYTDKHKQTDFENSIEAIQTEANRLIDLWINFQPWNKILTIQEFEILCSDPVKFMDLILQKNSGVNLEATGGRLPAPDQVAKLLDIDRDNFINIVKGLKVTEVCKPCNKTAKIIKQGQGVLSHASFRKYQEYLIFDNNKRFSINETALEKKKHEFEIFAETPDQIQCYKFWLNLCETLNSLPEKNYCGDLIPFQTLLKNRLMFSYANNKLNVNMELLINEIILLKN